MADPICPGCTGRKTFPVRVQRLVRGRRICATETMECPICRGTGSATEQQEKEWLAREFPGIAGYLPD